MPAGLKKSLLFDDVHGRLNAINTPDDTTAWLREMNAYTTWGSPEHFERHKGLLSIKGKPGSGKSTVVKSAMMHEQERKSTSVASFYFNSKEDRSSIGMLHRSSVGMLRSLVYQLAKSDTSVCTALVEVWSQKMQDVDDKDGVKPVYQWYEDELQSFLKSRFASSQTQSTFLFIDALDECSTLSGDDDTTQEARDVLSFFRSLLATANRHGIFLRVCVSSRTIFTVGDGLCEIVLDQSNERAIAAYVKSRFANHGAAIVKEKLQSVASEIVRRASGIFLWAKLVMDMSLRYWDQGRNIDWIQGRFAHLHYDLEMIYRGILLSKPEDSEEESRTTVRFFQWIIFSSRPLQLREWYAVVGLIQEVPPKSMKEWTESKDFPRNAGELAVGDTLEKWIKRVSRGLVEVSQAMESDAEDVESTRCATAGSAALNDGETRRVYVIHETVREFFHKTGFSILAPSLFFPRSAKIDGHRTIIKNCLHYLLITELDRWARRRLDSLSTADGGGLGIHKAFEYPLYASAASSEKLSDEENKPGLPMPPLEREPGNIEGLSNVSPGRRFSLDRTSSIADWLCIIEESTSRDRSPSSPPPASASLPFRTKDIEDEMNTAMRSVQTTKAHSVKAGPSIVEDELYAGKTSSSLATSLKRGARSARFEGDVFALIEYATNDIFVHASIEELQRHNIEWLTETMLRAWDRIVLLRPDLKRNASFIEFCFTAGLNALIIPTLERPDCKTSAAVTFMLACSHQNVEILRELVFRHIRSTRNISESSSSNTYSSLLPSLFFPPGFQVNFSTSEEVWVDIWMEACKLLQEEGSVTAEEVGAVFDNSSPKPLLTACKTGNFTLVEKLLDMGADPEIKDEKQDGPVNYLCSYVDEWSDTCLSILSRLLDRAAHSDDSTSTKDGNAFHHLFKRRPRFEPFSLLLSAGVDPRQRNSDFQTPLHLLCQRQWRHYYYGKNYKGPPKLMEMGQIMTALIRHGAEVNAIDRAGKTPMHYLSQDGQDDFFPLITMLLHHGASLELCDASGRQPHFDLFARSHNALNLRFLHHLASLQDFASKALRDNYGNTPLSIHVRSAATAFMSNTSDLVVRENFLSLYRLVKYFGFDVNIASEAGISPDPLLHVLCRAREPGGECRRTSRHLLKLFRLVLALGANVHTTDLKGRTALHWASVMARLEMMKQLVTKYGAQVNTSDNDGNTPLHLVAISYTSAEERNGTHPRRMKCAMLLLKAGASATATNDNMETPAQSMSKSPPDGNDTRHGLQRLLEQAEASDVHLPF